MVDLSLMEEGRCVLYGVIQLKCKGSARTEAMIEGPRNMGIGVIRHTDKALTGEEDYEAV